MAKGIKAARPAKPAMPMGGAMPPKRMPPTEMPGGGKPALTGRDNALTRVPASAPAYGLRGTKPPTKGKK